MTISRITLTVPVCSILAASCRIQLHRKAWLDDLSFGLASCSFTVALAPDVTPATAGPSSTPRPAVHRQAGIAAILSVSVYAMLY